MNQDLKFVSTWLSTSTMGLYYFFFKELYFFEKPKADFMGGKKGITEGGETLSRIHPE